MKVENDVDWVSSHNLVESSTLQKVIHWETKGRFSIVRFRFAFVKNNKKIVFGRNISAALEGHLYWETWPGGQDLALKRYLKKGLD